jgi:hypothetical protein
MPEICAEQVILMYDHPKEQLVALFNYGEASGAQAQVVGSSGLQHHNWAADMPLHFLRAARSGGRIDLHSVFTSFLSEGQTFRPILLPMHTATSQLHDCLARAAQLISPGWTQAEAPAFARRMVKRLIAEIGGGLVLIH